MAAFRPWHRPRQDQSGRPFAELQAGQGNGTVFADSPHKADVWPAPGVVDSGTSQHGAGLERLVPGAPDHAGCAVARHRRPQHRKIPMDCKSRRIKKMYNPLPETLRDLIGFARLSRVVTPI